MSNIVSGDRRARRSAAVAAPIDYAAIDKSSSDEDDDSANEQASSSEDGSDVVGEGTSLTTTSSWPIVQLQLLCLAHALTLVRQAPFSYDNSQCITSVISIFTCAMHCLVCCLSSFSLALGMPGGCRNQMCRLWGMLLIACLLMADEAVDMDDDACEADIAADASPPATSDVKKESKKSEKQTENGDADDNGMQDTEQEVAKVKRRKAVIDSDDSDDD